MVNIVDLNDECLCNLFERLDLITQQAVTKVCTRFRDLMVTSVYRRYYTQISTSCPTGRMITDTAKKYYENVTRLCRDEFEKFYTLNVNNIKKLHIGNLAREIFCSTLEKNVERPDVSFYLQFKYLSLIDMTCLDRNLNDENMKLIVRNCRLLNSLEISSPYITGKYIKGLRHLKRLNVYRCSVLPSNLEDIIREILTLEYLDVRYNESLRSAPLCCWGTSLRELHICETEFLPQFNMGYILPRHLGAIRIISIVCDINPLTLVDGLDVVRADWIPFFNFCGTYVKVLKWFYSSAPIAEAMECSYYSYYSAVFTRLQELHLKMEIPFNKLKALFTSMMTVHSLYVYNSLYLVDIARRLHHYTRLQHIYVKEHMGDARRYSKFMDIIKEQLRRSSSRREMTIHFEDVCLDLSSFTEPIEIIYKDEFIQSGSVLKIKYDIEKINQEQHWSRIHFELYDEDLIRVCKMFR